MTRLKTPLSNACDEMKMAKTSKIKRILMIGLLMSGFSIPAPQTPGQTDTEIVEIRAEVARINKELPRCKKTIVQVENISLEGTEATYYRLDGSLRKVTLEIFGETYRAAGEFYYADGGLRFAYIKEDRYDSPINLKKSPKIVRTEEQRAYFKDADIVRLLVGTRKLSPTDEKYMQLQREIMDISRKLVQQP
jgi:hypothetical protein